MKSRQLICAVVFPLIVLSIGVAVLLHEDRYTGRTVSEWLLMTRSSEAADALGVATVIRQIPKQKLFPVLREWMAKNDNSWRERFHRLVAKQHLVRIRVVSVREQRAAAFQAVAILGPEAKPLLPELSAALANPQPENVFDAAFALCTIGPDTKQMFERPAPNESRQARVARQAAQDILKTAEFTAATQNWPTQTVADVMRLRCMFNLKCLSASFASFAMRPRPKRMLPETSMPADIISQLDKLIAAETNNMPTSDPRTRPANPFE